MVRRQVRPTSRDAKYYTGEKCPVPDLRKQADHAFRNGQISLAEGHDVETS